MLGWMTRVENDSWGTAQGGLAGLAGVVGLGWLMMCVGGVGGLSDSEDGVGIAPGVRRGQRDDG